MNIAACVLAAGSSRRMGSPKAWLDAGGQPFVVRLLDSFGAAGVAPRFVVVAAGDPVLRAEPALDARVLVNPQPEHGMLSSLHVCLRAIAGGDTPRLDALFVAPVDCPWVRSETLAALVREFAATRAPVVVPRFGTRRGHPTLFAAAVFEELLHAPHDGGARTVVRAHASDRLEVAVEDPAVLDDIDTIAEWNRGRPA